MPQKVFQKYLDGTYLKQIDNYEEYLLLAFRQLNATGQDVAVEQIQELCKIEDYRKKIKSK